MFVPCEMLLHPELLSNEQLIHIMQERHLRIANIERMKRDELLEIFHSYCVPYGQRKYRDSGRGRLLNKTRPTSPEPAKNLHTMMDQCKKYTMTEQCNKYTNPESERIKPPPDLLSGHMKRIKLETTVTPVKLPKCLHNVKRKMSIDAATPAIDSPPAKKERKPITWP